MSASRILVVIPTYNCRSQILQLLHSFKSHKVEPDEVFWIVDNQSIDGTFEEATQFIKKHGLKQIFAYRAVQNNNLGGTHKIAFNEAIISKFDFVAIFHGDNQALIDDLRSMINLASRAEHKASILGARFMKGSVLVGYSRKRRIGNIILNSIFSLFTLRRLYDLGSGLNIYHVPDLKKINFVSFGDTLTFNYELILEMIRLDLTFSYMPISWKEEDQVSNAKNFKVFSSALLILARVKVPRRKDNLSNSKVYKVV